MRRTCCQQSRTLSARGPLSPCSSLHPIAACVAAPSQAGLLDFAVSRPGRRNESRLRRLTQIKNRINILTITPCPLLISLLFYAPSWFTHECERVSFGLLIVSLNFFGEPTTPTRLFFGTAITSDSGLSQFQFKPPLFRQLLHFPAFFHYSCIIFGSNILTEILSACSPALNSSMPHSVFPN